MDDAEFENLVTFGAGLGDDAPLLLLDDSLLQGERLNPGWYAGNDAGLAELCSDWLKLAQWVATWSRITPELVKWFRARTNRLTRECNGRKIDPKPFYMLDGEIELARTATWDSAWCLIRQLADTVATPQEPAAPESPQHEAWFIGEPWKRKKPKGAQLELLHFEKSATDLVKILKPTGGRSNTKNALTRWVGENIETHVGVQSSDRKFSIYLKRN